MKQSDLNRMMRQVQQMQADMAAAQEALAEETVEGTAGGGMVTAVVTGSGELRSVEINPEVVDPDDVEMLQDLVVAAVTDANRKAAALQQERLGGIAGGLDTGGLGGLLG
ncbi:MAG TPA: YbaB/EbfC family nucleoid-associated protein [Acidimicrobiia bacterium]|nr:YbaB/EbfC family nucleoid-associated protein [Acidimicrobiia bacterium]